MPRLPLLVLEAHWTAEAEAEEELLILEMEARVEEDEKMTKTLVEAVEHLAAQDSKTLVEVEEVRTMDWRTEVAEEAEAARGKVHYSSVTKEEAEEAPKVHHLLSLKLEEVEEVCLTQDCLILALELALAVVSSNSDLLMDSVQQAPNL